MPMTKTYMALLRGRRDGSRFNQDNQERHTLLCCKAKNCACSNDANEFAPLLQEAP
jgi:hypothetical protein